MKTWVSFGVHRYTPYYDARKEFFFSLTLTRRLHRLVLLVSLLAVA